MQSACEGRSDNWHKIYYEINFTHLQKMMYPGTFYFIICDSARRTDYYDDRGFMEHGKLNIFNQVDSVGF
jgi:hypothetical protein